MSKLDDLSKKFTVLGVQITAIAGNPSTPFTLSDSTTLSSAALNADTASGHIDNIIDNGVAVAQGKIDACEGSVNAAITSMTNIANGMPGGLTGPKCLDQINTANSLAMALP